MIKDYISLPLFIFAETILIKVSLACFTCSNSAHREACAVLFNDKIFSDNSIQNIFSNICLSEFKYAFNISFSLIHFSSPYLIISFINSTSFS